MQQILNLKQREIILHLEDSPCEVVYLVFFFLAVGSQVAIYEVNQEQKIQVGLSRISSYISEDLVSYLSGGSTFRERSLLEAADLIKAIQGTSKGETISQGLINPLKNEMLARAALAKGMMGSV